MFDWFFVGPLVVASAIVGMWLAPKWRVDQRARPNADLPRAFGCKMAWVAVRTRDTAKLIEALRLADARSESWSTGIGAVYNDQIGLKRVFVTPPIDDWSLVVGLSLPHPMGGAFEDRCSPFLLELSRKFGQVQYFASLPALEYFAWAVLRDGSMKRGFACGQEGVVWNRGAVTADERNAGVEGLGIREVRGAENDFHVPNVREEHVLRLARRWSLDPTRLDQRADLGAGVGYLATAPAEWQSAEASRKAA